MKIKQYLPEVLFLVLFIALCSYLSFFKVAWRDEAFSFFLSKLPISEIIRVTTHDFTPPLFYVLLHFWMMISQSLFFMRLLPLIFSLVFILILLSLRKQLYAYLKIKENLASQFLYLSLIIFNPIFIYFAIELRAYSLLMLQT
ncbi:hypothetical protein GYA19_06125, partial [Candidatus Beckwithbacteria bacterium]|nr:hypothetical protein [Candidatus Beckwithbacteria bacterium]